MADRAHVTIPERLDRLPFGVFHLALTAAPVAGLVLGSGAPLFVHQLVFGVPLLLAALIMAVLGIETRQRRLEEIAGPEP